MNREIIREAIIRANKLGAKGIQVISYAEPASAIQSQNLVLITRTPEQTTASGGEWYDR